MLDLPAPPSFEVSHGTRGSTRLVTVVGEVDLATSPDLADALRAALTAGGEFVAVDLTEVTFVDSSGVSALLAAHRHAMARDVRMVIMPPAPAVRATFRLCGVDSVLPFTRTDTA
jgi:anti-anti-sigma factor